MITVFFFRKLFQEIYLLYNYFQILNTSRADIKKNYIFK